MRKAFNLRIIAHGFVLLLALATAPGCLILGGGAGQTEDFRPWDDELWVREELTFGSDIPGGGMVTEEDWRQFLGEVVTQRFPEGFSVFSSYGQYLMSTGTIVKEKGWTIVLYVRELTPEKNRFIQEIIAEYKQRFRQESVLRASSPARVRFE
ncbi:MAG: DUF3574 domain-containing protein [Bacteroidota bacterium]